MLADCGPVGCARAGYALLDCASVEHALLDSVDHALLDPVDHALLGPAGHALLDCASEYALAGDVSVGCVKVESGHA